MAREGGTVAAPVATVEGMACTMNFEGWERGCEVCACEAVGAADLHMDFVSETTGREGVESITSTTRPSLRSPQGYWSTTICRSKPVPSVEAFMALPNRRPCSGCCAKS